MSGPDFIVIGAMKCGTTTLAAQLGAQEGIFITDPKEPNYFSDDDVYARGPEWYAGLFAGAGATDLRGEASTHYTKRPDLPRTVERMRAALPQVRLVYVIRDPMARIVSHYIHDWSQGGLSVPLDVALERHSPLVDYGLYGWQVEPFVEAYGAEAVLLTSLERMRADPEGELSRIVRHIGLEGPARWVEDREVENSSAKRSRKFPFYELLINHSVMRALRRALVPKALRTWVRTARQMKERPEIPAAMREALEARFAEDRARLARIFPNDPSLDLAYPFLEPLR